MIVDRLSLPEGRVGQALAIGISAAAVLAVSLGVIAPAVGWYQQRQARLSLAQQEIAHITHALPLIPLYRQEIIASEAGSRTRLTLLAGDSDAIAGADLQSEIASLTSATNATLVSTAILSVQPAGALRGVTLEVNLTATWPQLIALLAAINTARPRIILSNLTIENASQTAEAGPESVLQVSFSTTGFRSTKT
jgi:general secretion pathway protein M